MTTARPPRVVVARPNPQHSHRLAVALQNARMLEAYVTGLYTDWSQPPFSYARWLPDAARQGVEERVFRGVQRSHAELDPARVRTVGWLSNATMAMLHRSGMRAPWTSAAFARSSRRFQETAVEIAVDAGAELLAVYDTEAYYALLASRDTRLIRVMDAASVHWATRDEIYRREAQRWPEFSEGMELPSAYPAYFERACREPEMADYILVGSELAKRSFVEHGCAPERIFVVSYGCDVEQFHPGEDRSANGPFRLLYLGNRSAAKGFPYLWMLLERLSDLEIEAWLGGLDQTATPGAFGKVSIRPLGWQNRERVAALMRQADLLIHPTVLDSFSLTVLEAMASGLPVLTTTAAGVSDLIEHGRNGFVTPVGDIDMMESVVRRLYHDRACRSVVGAAARNAALAHTWRKYEEDVVAVFRKIAQVGRP